MRQPKQNDSATPQAARLFSLTHGEQALLVETLCTLLVNETYNPYQQVEARSILKKLGMYWMDVGEMPDEPDPNLNK